MFNVNDKVVYPGHGVAIIEEVVEKNVAGASTQFFKLVFPFKDMTVLGPQQRLEAAGIRALSSEEEILESLAELRRLPKLSSSGEVAPAGWSRRHREYQLKIQNGRLIDIASIYRDLMYTAQRKELSFGEKSLTQTTEELLSKEIFTSRKCSEEQALSAIRKPFFVSDNANQDKQKQVSSGA